MKKRENHTSGFKTKVVIEAIQERETIQAIGKKYNIHPNQISTWKTRFLSGASSVFETGTLNDNTEKEKADLFKKIGQLQMEVDFLTQVENAQV